MELRRAEMGFQLVDYNLLEKNIKESIDTELRSHRLNPRKLNKAIDALSRNHFERSIQCQYLLAVRDCLNTAAAHDKSAEGIEARKIVLNAAAYYVRAQIFDSYQGAVTPYFLAPENSTLFNSLTTSLNITTENCADTKDLRDMYVALERFMKAHVYKDSDSGKGYLEVEKQIFSADNIKGYKVEKVLTDLVQKIAALELEQIDKTREEYLIKESTLAQKSGASHLGMFKPKSITPSEESSILEHSVAIEVNV
jgi:hypothetical protein